MRLQKSLNKLVVTAQPQAQKVRLVHEEEDFDLENSFSECSS